MMEDILREVGYDVTSCTSSTECFKILAVRSSEFDLLISDQSMPNLTGIQMVNKLRHENINIPAIIITGYSNQISEENVGDLGIEELLIKPIESFKFCDVTRRVLDRCKDQMR